MIELHSDYGFAYRVTKNGNVMIYRNGKMVTTLRGAKAGIFIEKIGSLNFEDQQQSMARVTGNYKRGNER